MIVHLKILITVIVIVLPGPKTMAENWKIAQLRDPSSVVNVYSATNNTFHIGFGLLQYYQIKEKQLLPKDPVYLKLNEKLNAVEKASMPSK